ncbi:tRNA lysidine(34) synthetase TilS [Candidatus Mycoplasma mahonii]|uniref:tRNA lysidine(34) synthetase TilS n=1 Tax=Candidatus Mycoplasma mahonii TaxID=3004105 RepID=UPI0026E9F5E0|nr:tRNA lysidine(34) synthetase TilS [Candidatus Mycoplasma mahonii]WKX02411.1 tRNA lysidine(34) synthetase TilS [Candidatus Mycoplasma mahonii]
MLLLAVSGGPDSMFLLNEYKKKGIIVAHINYNLRTTSMRDENIVRNFCKQHNIHFKLLSVKLKPTRNTEAWARKIRYDFFNKIYTEFNCNKLLTGHHRDDFLETGLMQQRSNRTPRYYGIKKVRMIDGMKVYRPFIDLYWKNEISIELKKKKINYGLDETNNDLKILRNKIRKEIKDWTPRKKKSVVSWFKICNKILKKKFKKIDNCYAKWKESNFSIKFFNLLKKYKEELVFELIHDKFNNVQLTGTKINSIISFIDGIEGNKKYKLKDGIYLIKRNGFIS